MLELGFELRPSGPRTCLLCKSKYLSLTMLYHVLRTDIECLFSYSSDLGGVFHLESCVTDPIDESPDRTWVVTDEPSSLCMGENLLCTGTDGRAAMCRQLPMDGRQRVPAMLPKLHKEHTWASLELLDLCPSLAS